MATVTIRNLPDDMIQRLKERAKRNGRSMEQEAREILSQRLAARSELLNTMRARWPDITYRPSASQVNEWILAGRRGRK